MTTFSRRFLALLVFAVPLGCSSAPHSASHSTPRSAPYTAPQAPPIASVDGAYDIVKVQDTSIAQARRYKFIVRVPGPLGERALRTISREIIRKAPPANGMSILFYLPDSGIDRHYAVGMADWWPNGRVGDAIGRRPGDYSKHRLDVKVGPAVGRPFPKPKLTAHLPLTTRRQAYHDLVYLEDRGYSAEAGATMVMAKYGLPRDAIREISLEGSARSWPMPSP